MSVATGERRLLIDGKLVDSESGATFDNINPATLEVLGPVADATPADMVAAIAAARRAFDTTTWATDHAFRRECLFQLQAALVSEQEELRVALEEWHAAVPGYSLKDGIELRYSQGLRSVDNLELVW